MLDKIKNDRKNNKKKTKSSPYFQVDELLIEWYQQNKTNNFSVCDPMIQIKADELVKVINDYFECSSWYLDRVKTSTTLFLEKVCGESTSIDSNLTNDWFSKV